MKNNGPYYKKGPMTKLKIKSCCLLLQDELNPFVFIYTLLKEQEVLLALQTLPRIND
jgi:hypothetical protein